MTGFFLWHHWPQMMRLMAESPITAMGNAMDLVGLCALLVVLGVIPMVGFDVFFQIFSHLILTGYHTGFAGIDLRSIKQTLVFTFLDATPVPGVFQQHHQQLAFDLLNDIHHPLNDLPG